MRLLLILRLWDRPSICRLSVISPHVVHCRGHSSVVSRWRGRRRSSVVSCWLWRGSTVEESRRSRARRKAWATTSTLNRLISPIISGRRSTHFLLTESIQGKRVEGVKVGQLTRQLVSCGVSIRGFALSKPYFLRLSVTAHFRTTINLALITKHSANLSLTDNHNNARGTTPVLPTTSFKEDLGLTLN